jgi:diketogulonate reductase-like aldo/keto reductase
MAAAHFTLNTGARVPSVALGTYKAAPGVVTDVVAAAVKVFALLARPPYCSSFF